MIGNFSIREILETFRECGIWSSFPGDSRMIREESHVCSYRADKDSYPHNGCADKGRYRHDSHADKNPYRHDRGADSPSRPSTPKQSTFL